MKDMTAYDRFLERQRIADERARKMGYGKAMQDAIEPAPAQPLTDARTKLLWHEARRCIGPRWMAFKRLIEADHGIKENT